MIVLERQIVSPHSRKCSILALLARRIMHRSCRGLLIVNLLFKTLQIHFFENNCLFLSF